MEEDVEENVADLGDLLKSSTHEEIIQGLQDRQLHLGDLCRNGKSTKIVTVYRAILTETTNGNKLVKNLLDQSVSQVGNNFNHAESHLRIDLGIFLSKKNERRANLVVKDLINFRSKTSKALLTHPVIESFINVRWKKWKRYFLANFVIYFLFLIMYSSFLGKFEFSCQNYNFQIFYCLSKKTKYVVAALFD